MKIIVWLTSVLGISIILGELYSRYLKKKKEKKNEKFSNILDSIDETIDTDTGNLRIESPDMISKYNNISHSSFSQLRNDEYKKKL